MSVATFGIALADIFAAIWLADKKGWPTKSLLANLAFLLLLEGCGYMAWLLLKK